VKVERAPVRIDRILGAHDHLALVFEPAPDPGDRRGRVEQALVEPGEPGLGREILLDDGQAHHGRNLVRAREAASSTMRAGRRRVASKTTGCAPPPR
jgi:hypothetical protein